MKIYNTLTKQKEEFKPIKEGHVMMYVCGPTVYNYIHIGNARPFIVFEAFRSYLEYRGYKVKFVQNFTDVDDKIINRAKELGVPAIEVSDKYIEEYNKDAEALGIRPANKHPRVTETMDEIIKFIIDLINGGFAYEVDGDVYFDTSKKEDYGKLSGKSIEDLIAGARVDVNDKKKNPSDFALWKAKKEESEISWNSPWSEGRPGWHIECSVMSNIHLAHTIDIHAGGQDLIFPHHENEIAQSESHSGHIFANYWMHNGYINIDGEKMSKSKGNFFTVREILNEFTGQEIRFFILSSHYRGPINFSHELMEQARVSMGRIINCKENLAFLIKNAITENILQGEQDSLNEIYAKKDDFIAALDDDFNTASAISVIFEVVRMINSLANNHSSGGFLKQMLEFLNELTDVLNIAKIKKSDLSIDSKKIEELIEKRAHAKKAKDFALADSIRDELDSMGVVIEDTRAGTKWQIKA